MYAMLFILQYMKSKLKKKTKLNQIIFPHQFRNQDVDTHLISQTQKLLFKQSHPRDKPKIKEQQNEVRFTSKLSSFCIHNKVRNRSYSHKNCKTISLDNHTKEKSSLLKQLQAQTNNNISTLRPQFSKVFYKKMNQNLLQECRNILEQKTPFRSQSLCNMQKISSNLYYIKKKNKPQSLTVQNQVCEQQGQENYIKPVSISQIYKPELQVVRLSQIQKQAYSHLEISYSQEDFSFKNSAKDSGILRKNSLIFDRNTQILVQPLITSQSNDCKIIDLLNFTDTFMVSSKLLFNSSGFFKIQKIDFTSTDNCYLQVFLQFLGQTVYKKISLNYEKRIFDARSRKNQLKKIHHFKDKMRQKIFMHFSKVCSSKQVIPFFQDLLSFIQQYLHLQRTYLGLVFKNYEDFSFALLTNQRFQNQIKAKHNFFFLIKLKGTYYLVKADFRNDNLVKFTLVNDFTSLSSGDQLTFQQCSSLSCNLFTQAKIHKFFPKIYEDFVLNTIREWEGNRNQRQFQTSSAKIGKVIIQNIYKWGATDAFQPWDTLWNNSNMYTLLSQRKIFFIYHSQFEYGFFKTLKFQHLQGYHYKLSQNCSMSLYNYPQNYQYIQLSQTKMQALVIPHLPVSHKKVKRCVVLSFFRKEEMERKKKKWNTFEMVVKNFKIQLKASKKLQIYFQCLKNYHRYKLVFPSQNKILTVHQLTKKIFGLFNDYRIKVGLIYSKFSKDRDDIVVLYKGLHKFQMQFFYVTLYKITALNLVEFRVHAFKMNRNFIVRIQNVQFSQESLKSNVSALITYFKNVYFKTLLHYQALKSKKRRKDALQDFLKNQIKANPNNLRPKRKIEEEKRRKLMRLASMKCCQEGSNVYEDIISRVFYNSKGQIIYLTLRNLPVSQIDLPKVPDQQIIELQLFIEDKIAHFKYQLPFKDIMSVMRGRNKYQISSLKQMYLILKQVAEKIKKIVEKPFQTIDFVFLNIKTFIDPYYSRKEEGLSPFKFKIIGNHFFQINNTFYQEKKLNSKLSIDFNLFKPCNFNRGFVQGSHLLKEVQNDISVDGDCFHNAYNEISKTIYTYVKQKWIVRVIDVVCQQQEWTLLAQQKNCKRQIKMMNLDSNQSYMLSEWEGHFLGGIMYQQFNKRMIKRVIRSIKMAL